MGVTIQQQTERPRCGCYFFFCERFYCVYSVSYGVFFFFFFPTRPKTSSPPAKTSKKIFFPFSPFDGFFGTKQRNLQDENTISHLKQRKPSKKRSDVHHKKALHTTHISKNKTTTAFHYFGEEKAFQNMRQYFANIYVFLRGTGTDQDQQPTRYKIRLLQRCLVTNSNLHLSWHGFFSFFPRKKAPSLSTGLSNY